MPTITPKSPEMLLAELDSMYSGDIEVPKYFPAGVAEEWFSASLLSLLAYVEKEENALFSRGIIDTRSVVKNITKEIQKIEEIK